MKIAFVITRSDEIGGAHIHVRDMASWLLQQGHDVHVFVGGDDIFSDELRRCAVPVSALRRMKRPISPLNDLLAVKELENHLRSFSPNIISAHSAKAGMITRIACFKAKIPCIYTAHGWSYISGGGQCSKLIFTALEKALAPLSKRIITVCETDREFAIRKGIASEKKVTTIHNGMPSVDSVTLGSTGLPKSDDPTIIMVARFEAPKDHETVIKALSSIKDLSWNLQLVGDGPLQEKVRDMVKEYEMESRVSFLGRRQDVAALLATADIFTMISDVEGFPRSILEGMRAGLPVISTNVGGVKESVTDQETGYIIEPRDHERLSRRLKQLIESKALREKMGAKGLEDFEAHFTFEAMATSTLALYKQVSSESAKSEEG